MIEIMNLQGDHQIYFSNVQYQRFQYSHIACYTIFLNLLKKIKLMTEIY